MFCFAALVWDDSDARAADAARHFQNLLRSGPSPLCKAQEQLGYALYVFGSASKLESIIPIRSSDGSPVGAVLGTIFRKSNDLKPSPPVALFDNFEVRTLVESLGRNIIDDYWGNYVAIIKHRDVATILAAPTSGLPCFFTRQRNVTIAFSHLEKCTFLDRSALSINLGYLSDLVAYDKIQNRRTGLNEICELLGGTRLTIRQEDIEIDNVWEPRRVAADVYSPELETASSLLQKTTDYVVHSWATPFSEVAVNVSGGLDSAIVLSSLAKVKTPSEISAFHHVVESEDATEVLYARAVADHFHCELNELHFKPHYELPPIHEHPLTVRPYRRFLAPDLSEFSDKYKASGRPIFTGQGGDHLFHVKRTPFGFGDYIHNRGAMRGAFSELISSAKLSRKSIWDVLADYLSHLISRTSTGSMEETIYRNKTPLSGLAHERLNVERCLPPWAIDPCGLPRGKFDQVSGLLHLFLVRETLDRPVLRDLVHPLISQPLIELCLRLPIYILTCDGVSRGLARAAFKGRIPESVRTRVTKGETTRYSVNHIESNFPVLSDALKNSELASHGIIPMHNSESFPSFEDLQIAKLGRRMSIYYAIEAWFRAWKTLNPSIHCSWDKN